MRPALHLTPCRRWVSEAFATHSSPGTVHLGRQLNSTLLLSSLVSGLQHLATTHVQVWSQLVHKVVSSPHTTVASCTHWQRELTRIALNAESGVSWVCAHQCTPAPNSLRPLPLLLSALRLRPDCAPSELRFSFLSRQQLTIPRFGLVSQSWLVVSYLADSS